MNKHLPHFKIPDSLQGYRSAVWAVPSLCSLSTFTLEVLSILNHLYL